MFRFLLGTSGIRSCKAQCFRVAKPGNLQKAEPSNDSLRVLRGSDLAGQIFLESGASHVAWASEGYATGRRERGGLVVFTRQTGELSKMRVQNGAIGLSPLLTVCV